MNELPKKEMTNWYAAASRLDNQYRRLMQMLGTPTIVGQGTRPSARNVPAPTIDEDAMDVDTHINATRLSVAQRERCQRENLCFNCQKPGHRSFQCRQKRQGQGRGQYQPRNNRTGQFERRRVRTNEAEGEDDAPRNVPKVDKVLQLRQMMADLDADELDRLNESFEREGFQSGDLE